MTAGPPPPATPDPAAPIAVATAPSTAVATAVATATSKREPGGAERAPTSSGSLRQSLTGRLVTPAYKTAAAIAQRLPRGAADRLAGVGAIAMRRLLGERLEMVERHQRRLAKRPLSDAELRTQVDRALESYARYWVDAFRLNGQSTPEIDAGIHVDGAERIDEARALGKGVIMAMPHIGAWDYGGAWVAHHWPLTVVAERLEPPELFEWFCARRAENHMRVVGLGPEAGPVLVKALADNEVIGLLCDRDIAGGGIEVEFFGEKTTLPAGPAALSLRTGAVILPNAVYQRGARAHGVIRPPLQIERTGKFRADVARLTQALANELEALIAAAPEQWHVLQPNWPSDRNP